MAVYNATTETQHVVQDFFAQLQNALQQDQLQKVVLSKYQGQEPLQRITLRPVMIKQQALLSFVYTYKTNDQTKNFDYTAALAELTRLAGSEFKNLHLLTASHEIQLTFSKKGKAALFSHKLQNAAQEAAVNKDHNREKQRYLTLERPFLQELGITDAQHKLIPAMSRKWKQINKFIEIFSRALQSTDLIKQGKVHVADFGSGKAYLTFAVHDYLRHTLQLDAKVTGVELRQELVQLCNDTACKLDLNGIDFQQGDVKHFAAQGINIMIALHACDVATDYAIHMGIRTGADIIMCSPCCHKQIRPQMHSPLLLQPLLQHGIHLGQEAEMITDSLRAMLLEAWGYDTQVFEFISLEHTSKNKMILAVKNKLSREKKAEKYQKIMAQIQAIKEFYGIKEQCLESLLAENL